MTTCSIEYDDSPAVAHGLCHLHYAHWLRRGQVEGHDLSGRREAQQRIVCDAVREVSPDNEPVDAYSMGRRLEMHLHENGYMLVRSSIE